MAHRTYSGGISIEEKYSIWGSNWGKLSVLVLMISETLETHPIGIKKYLEIGGEWVRKEAIPSFPWRCDNYRSTRTPWNAVVLFSVAGLVPGSGFRCILTGHEPRQALSKHPKFNSLQAASDSRGYRDTKTHHHLHKKQAHTAPHACGAVWALVGPGRDRVLHDGREHPRGEQSHDPIEPQHPNFAQAETLRRERASPDRSMLPVLSAD
jgi:hypothetical protein